MLLQRCLFSILLHATLFLNTTCQDQEPGCSADGCQELHVDDKDPDLWMLQLSQNISLINHTVQASLANATKEASPAALATKASHKVLSMEAVAKHNTKEETIKPEHVAKASSTATHHNETVARDQSAPRRLLQALQTSSVLKMQRETSTGLILLDTILVIVLAVIISSCIVSFTGMRSAARNQPPSEGSAPSASRMFDGEKSVAVKGVQDAVPPPILCPELILPSSETRFCMSMKALLDQDSDHFPILSPSGTTHFEAKIEEGRALFLYSPGHDVARIMLQVDIRMVNILDGQGRFFGKIEAQPNRGGLVLYHKNKPSVIIRIIDIASYSMVATPIIGSGKIATMVSNGATLRCQVKNGIDPVVFLGTFIALISLKSSLLQLGVIDMSSPM